MLCGGSGKTVSIRGDPADVRTTTYSVGMIPAFCANDFEFGIKEPLLGTSAVQSDQCGFAVRAPSVRTRCIGVITPVEADALSRVDGIRDVLAYESDPLATVLLTVDGFGHRLVRTTEGFYDTALHEANDA